VFISAIYEFIYVFISAIYEFIHVFILAIYEFIYVFISAIYDLRRLFRYPEACYAISVLGSIVRKVPACCAAENNKDFDKFINVNVYINGLFLIDLHPLCHFQHVLQNVLRVDGGPRGEAHENSIGVYICKSIVNDLRHGKFHMKMRSNLPSQEPPAS
jgi:hypothetical protein